MENLRQEKPRTEEKKIYYVKNWYKREVVSDYSRNIIIIITLKLYIITHTHTHTCKSYKH